MHVAWPRILLGVFTLSSHYTKLIRIALIFGGAGFLVFAGFSLLAWKFYPYQPSDDELTRQIRWLVHCLGEKIGSLVLVSVLAFFAARAHRPTWKMGVFTGIAAAIVFQLIAVVVYLVRFGPSVYRTYNDFIYTTSSTVELAWLFAFFAVWKQYRRERQAS